MDDETRNRIADFFEAWELAEYLKLDTLALIVAFEDDVLDKLDDIEELMEYHHD